MFRLSSAVRLSRRLLHTHSAKTDTLLDQFKRTTNEFHVFQLVRINRHLLTLDHVAYAMNLLWNFHNMKSKYLRTSDHIRKHPEFLALGSMAENNITFMDDQELVNILNIVDRFQEDAHSSLVQALVTEGWKRLQRLDLPALSIFAASLKRQNMDKSPLMGQIANIVDLSLDNLKDPVILSSFIDSLYVVSSPSLQERLIRKTESTLEKLDVSHLPYALRLMGVLYKDKQHYLGLFKKCDQLFQKNISTMDLETICKIIKVYRFLNFHNCEFAVAARPRLMKEVDLCHHPCSFADLFVALSPMVSKEMRERLENKLLTIAEELSLENLLDVVKTLAATECTKADLIQKIYLLLQNHLESCEPVWLYIVAKAVHSLDFQDERLYAKLQKNLKRHIMASFVPFYITLLTQALSLLSPNQIDNSIVSKLDDILAQCSVCDLRCVTFVVKQLQSSTRSYREKSIPLSTLQEKVNRYKAKRVRATECIDSLITELKDKFYFLKLDDTLLEDTLHTSQRLLYQISWKNVSPASTFALKMNALCVPLLDRISAVTMDNITKIYPTSVYPIVRVFAYMNYKPREGEEFFQVCTRHVLNNLDSFSPPYLVLITHVLVVAGHFPEELIRSIFNIRFLRRFDAHVDAFYCGIGIQVRDFLMQLNRAICIEKPEYQVPWFHEQYCQQALHKENREMSLTHCQIKLLLEQILGGSNYIKMSVRIPYGYLIDFECILDKNRKPLSYLDYDAPSIGSSKLGECDQQSLENKSLPAGAQRCAVEFLQPRKFLRNFHQLRGTYAMKKRHLEILGYRPVQIPFYEWNSQALGTKDAWTSYLRKKIFVDDV